MSAPIATSTHAVSPAAAIAIDRLGSSAKATQAEVAADAMRATIATIVRALSRSSAARASVAAASKIPPANASSNAVSTAITPDRRARGS
jgi:hypothetical protein